MKNAASYLEPSATSCVLALITVGMVWLLKPDGEWKAWFNRGWPYWRRCLHPGCWRGQTWQHRCPKHQDSQ